MANDTRPTPWKRRLQIAGMVVLGVVAGGIVSLIPTRPLPDVPACVNEAALTERFDDFVARNVEAAKAQGVTAGNEERYVVAAPNASRRIGMLYIHGFGATRAEGEAVFDELAKEIGASVYYVRLPGHGATMQMHAESRPNEYFQAVDEAFHRLRAQSDRMVLTGTSTGALFSIWLASRHPKDVDAVMIGSTLIELKPAATMLLSRRMGMPLIELLLGATRNAGFGPDPHHRKQPGYDEHWITLQRYSALSTLEDMRRVMARPEVFASVEAPILQFYYYANEETQDPVVDVGAMKRAFTMMNHGKPHPLSREVAIADGNHILTSAYVRSDKERILSEGKQFLKEALGQENGAKNHVPTP